MLKTINNGKQPTKATKYSAGIDLYANEDVTIWQNETKSVGLGVCIDTTRFVSMGLLIEDHYFELQPRSSLRAKGIIAGTGIIDPDYVYPNEVKIILHNFSCEPKFEIKKGDRIAQILLKEHKGYLFGIESNEERKGGFGSTDK